MILCCAPGCIWRYSLRYSIFCFTTAAAGLLSIPYLPTSTFFYFYFFLKKDDAHDALYIFMSRKEQRAEREREWVILCIYTHTHTAHTNDGYIIFKETMLYPGRCSVAGGTDAIVSNGRITCWRKWITHGWRDVYTTGHSQKQKRVYIVHGVRAAARVFFFLSFFSCYIEL